MQTLKESGIPTAVYYRKPMHIQGAFTRNKFGELDYSMTEKICGRCLSLPMHPYLNADNIERIADIIGRV